MHPVTHPVKIPQLLLTCFLLKEQRKPHIGLLPYQQTDPRDCPQNQSVPIRPPPPANHRGLPTFLPSIRNVLIPHTPSWSCSHSQGQRWEVEGALSDFRMRQGGEKWERAGKDRLLGT